MAGRSMAGYLWVGHTATSNRPSAAAEQAKTQEKIMNTMQTSKKTE